MDDIVIDTINTNSFFMLSDILYSKINSILKLSRPIVVLCIGTDRATGDCLGPLVGEKLKFLNGEKISIYGNLEFPVHAKNILDFLDKIHNTYQDPYIIAVDSSLGSIQNIGKIIISEKPLSPGAALNKSLPLVGDLSITGTVNIAGAFEFIVLQNTRLFTVMKLADIISKSIYHSFIKATVQNNNFSETNTLSK